MSTHHSERQSRHAGRFTSLYGETERTQVLALAAHGLRSRAIARRTGISRSYVSKIIADADTGAARQ